MGIPGVVVFILCTLLENCNSYGQIERQYLMNYERVLLLLMKFDDPSDTLGAALTE